MDVRLDTFHIGSWAVAYRTCHCHYFLLEPVPPTLEPAHFPCPSRDERTMSLAKLSFSSYGSSRAKLTAASSSDDGLSPRKRPTARLSLDQTRKSHRHLREL